MVVSRFLQGEAPLVSQLDLADGLCAEGTVDLARGRVALLGGAVVLDAAAVADEVVAGGLAVAIVGGAELDNAVALVLGHALHRRHQVVKGPEDALWRGQQRRRGGIRHRDELSHGGERERRGPLNEGNEVGWAGCAQIGTQRSDERLPEAGIGCRDEERLAVVVALGMLV